MNEGCRLKRRRKWRPRILQELLSQLLLLLAKQVLADGAKGLMCVGGCNHSNRKSGEKSCCIVFLTAFYLSFSLTVPFSLCLSRSAISLSLAPCVFNFVACCRRQRCINFIKSARLLKGALPCTRCYPWAAAAAGRVTVIVIVTLSITAAVAVLTVALAALVVDCLVHLFVSLWQRSFYANTLRFNYAPNSSCSQCSSIFHCDSWSESNSRL